MRLRDPGGGETRTHFIIGGSPKLSRPIVHSNARHVQSAHAAFPYARERHRRARVGPRVVGLRTRFYYYYHGGCWGGALWLHGYVANGAALLLRQTPSGAVTTDVAPPPAAVNGSLSAPYPRVSAWRYRRAGQIAASPVGCLARTRQIATSPAARLVRCA